MYIGVRVVFFRIICWFQNYSSDKNIALATSYVMHSAVNLKLQIDQLCVSTCNGS